VRILIVALILAVQTLAFAEGSADIPTILKSQADAWNRGDLTSFMAAYLETPEMTYTAGGKIVVGYQALHDRYEKAYGNTPETMGKLRFDSVTVTPLGDDHALVVGRWYVTQGEKEMDGVFSLVWVKTPKGWKILHDHSSRTVSQ